MTGLKKTRDEVGSMDLPDVLGLLEYWLDFPPEHVLLRALVGYEGRKRGRGFRTNWPSRKQRAEEMQDDVYKPELEAPEESEKDRMIRATTITEARHLDCAPGHVQVMIERFKQGRHLDFEDPQK